MSMNHPEEFIGKEINVVQARNKTLEGIKGKIIDETRNSFQIRTNNQEKKTLLKQGTIFMINENKIKGSDIIRRPEERIRR